MSVTKRAAIAVAIVVIAIVIAGLGFDSWRGGGFDRSGTEMVRLLEVLKLTPDMTVADVGAGRGDLTVALAEALGPRGQVFSTDLDATALEEIRARISAAGLRNVTVAKAGPRDTGLPTDCCDAIVMRRVYHHLGDPDAINVDLLRALRPGGMLVVIDFPPALSWLWPWPPTGAAVNRRGHGVAADVVVAEVRSRGFEVVNVIDAWPGRGPLGSYCAIFRRRR